MTHRSNWKSSNIVKESQNATKALEYKNALYRKALSYIEMEKQAKKVEEAEKPLHGKIDEDVNSSDSVELKNMSERLKSKFWFDIKFTF